MAYMKDSNGRRLDSIAVPATSEAATALQGTKADGAAQKASNLSDLASAATARSNLGAMSGEHPHKFGAVGDGVTDDTAALQSWLNSAPVTGGILYLPAGKYLVPNGGLTRTGPVTIIGAGAGGYETASGGARILCSSSTATLLTLASPGCVIEGVTFENTSGTRPTAGAALYATDFDWGRIERCGFVGFWNQVQIDTGYFYSICHSTFLRPVNYGCFMQALGTSQHDHGDQVLEGNVFSKYGDTTYGGTAIRWESGGGLRLIGNKANAGTQPGYGATNYWEYGFVASFATLDTSVLLISGNSFEGFKVDGIKVIVAAGAIFGKIAITGNELLSSGTLGSGYAINLEGPGNTSLNNVVVTGNVAYGGCGGVRLYLVRFAVVTGNSFYHCLGDAINMTYCLGIKTRDNLLTTQIVDNDANRTDNELAEHNRSPWEYSKNVYALTGTASYGKVKPGVWSAGILTVRVHGDVATVGGVLMEQNRVVTTTGNAGSSVVVIGSAVGTDIAIGAAAAELSLTYVLSTAECIKPTVTSINGKSFRGAIHVSYRGNVWAWYYAD